MGKLLDCIREHDAQFMAQQKVFFVATAPLHPHHRVNLSPKAPGTSLVVLNPHRVAYLDLTGSGSETAAHLAENGRMTILFCHLEEGPPRLMRLHGKAHIVLKDQADAGLLNKFPESLRNNPGFRAIYVMDVDRVSSSCGYSMPILNFDRYRTKLDDWCQEKGSKAMAEYGIKKNSFSIDGMPSLAVMKSHQERGGDYRIVPKPTDGYIYGEKVPSNPVSLLFLQIRHGVARFAFMHHGSLMFLCGMLVATILQKYLESTSNPPPLIQEL